MQFVGAPAGICLQLSYADLEHDFPERDDIDKDVIGEIFYDLARPLANATIIGSPGG